MKKLSIPIHSRPLRKGRKTSRFHRQQRNNSTPLYTLIGIVKRHPDGFGFFIPEDSTHSDVYLPKPQMQGLMNNDKVKVAVFSRKHQKGLFSGKILQLIERTQDHIVGQYWSLSSKTGLIKDDSFQWGEDLKIQLKKDQNIKKGEWVQAKIIHGPESSHGLKGEIICSLGLFPDGQEDNIRVIQKHGIPASFSTECIKETKKISEEIPKNLKRKNLKSLDFITIDGQTAQDFDDAIYVSSHSKGWTLYTAIADVSYYVKPKSALDKEAYKRGNSTYLPGFTVPMLPEKLSNNLCSLKPNENRLAFVAEIHFNQTGEIKNYQFYEALVQSRARMTYGEVQEIIEKQKDVDSRPLRERVLSENNDHPSISKNIRSAEKLARLLLEKRLQKYFIHLEIPETEVILDARGEPIDIVQSRRLFSHQLIEELMLVTNKTVAEFLKRKETPTLYRIHDPPKAESLRFLELFVQGLSKKVTFSKKNLHKTLSSLINQFKNHPIEGVLHNLILRSLSQAIYSNNNKKHFGLNTKYYTHFTSPIRRYSDLVVHRTLKAVLNQKTLYKQQDLESIAKILSACEQRSVKAERQLKDIKRARFIKKHLGQTMEGMICNVTNFGFFVKLRLYDIEGLVHIKQLKGKWFFEKSLLELKSKHSGKRLKIGDLVVVQIIASNIDTGQIDFELIKHKLQKIKPKTAKDKPISSNSNKHTNNKRTKKKMSTRKKQRQKCTKKRRRKHIH